ncbi:ABC transporter permease subunit [Mycoplasma sp. 46852]|uniref:ABC transporter permease subunit n=1 Tax=Mycoplasma sp. 46852 TaxID=3401683 RepID=UPI003AAFE314
MAESNIKRHESPFIKKTITAFESAKHFLMMDDKRASRRKLYSSIWAVIFGLIFASIIYLIMGVVQNKPVGFFDFIINIFSFGFNSEKIDTSAIFFIFFGFAGLAVAIGFKSGLFNIGISGQITFPTILFFAILILSGQDTKTISSSYFIGMFVIFIMGGAIIGSISGILKAFFNVHEVISTIFLNWILVFVCATLFNTSKGAFPLEKIQVLESSGSIVNGKLSEIQIDKMLEYNFIYFGIALFFVIAIGMWFIYSKTTLGYKIKMVGLNKTNAKYVGINEKLVTISVMFFSGALAGIGGFFYIIFKLKTPSIEEVPLAIGFESIAIALIALNNPIGIIPTAGLYGLLYSSQDLFSIGLNNTPELDSKYFPIVTGIIIFMTALSIVFYKFRVIDSVRKYIVLFCHKEYWANFKNYHKITLKDKKHKSWEKEKALFNAQYLQKFGGDEKLLLSKEYKKELKSYKKAWLTNYKEAKQKNSLEIKELQKQRKNELSRLKSEFDQNVSKINNKQSDEYYAFWTKYLSDINNLSNNFDSRYLELYNEFHFMSHKKELSVIKKTLKPRKIEFNYYKKQYDLNVSKLILNNKGADTKQLMSMYDEISKLKFELQRKRVELGLNQYQDLINKYKAQSKNTKIIYKSIKNEIFNNFEIKYFKKPYNDLVVKYTPILNEKGEEI